MTQPSEDSSKLLSDPHAPPGAMLMDESGEFLFELDRYLQCVSEFELNPEAAGPAAIPSGFDQRTPATASTPRVDGKLGELERNRVGHHNYHHPQQQQQQKCRKDEITVTSNVAMFDAPDLGTDDIGFRQASPVMYNQNHLLLRQPSSSTSFGTWSHTESGESRYSQGNAEQGFAAPVQQGNQDEKARYFSTTPDVPKQRNQNRSRKRQRQELEQLRSSVQKLQIQLETLLAGDTPDELSCTSRKQERVNFLDEALAWKRTASIEKQQSEHAVIENMKLRALVEENLILCESFREICSQDGISMVPREIGSSFVDVDTELESSVVLPDSEVFASLRDGLDAQYQRVNTVWDECDFTNSNEEIKLPNKLQSDGEGSFFLEHRQSHIFPFSTGAVSQTTWSLTKGGYQSPRNGELKVWQFMDNTLYVTINDTVSLENAPDSTIKVWIALKRFIEGHRIVIVWRTKLEVEHSSSAHLLSETGWNTARSLASSQSKSSLKAVPCISQTCVRVTPEQTSRTTKEDLSEDSLTARVVDKYHKNMSMFNQEVENILVDEALASRSSRRGNRKSEAAP